jgi:alkylhydroperoxidase/carboxymuconolactone decarboxylase family protein YurZ
MKVGMNMEHAAAAGPDSPGELRRLLFGDEHVNRRPPREDGPAYEWRRVSDDIAWSRIWMRPGLDHRSRSICTITTLAALGEMDQLKLHIGGALRLGVTHQELTELFIHVGLYAGMPRAAAAIQLLDMIVTEADH